MILSEIEKRIKEKIEKVGIPLKDWNIDIYRGVLTGYNEAFIIDGKKKDEILNNCKTEEERLRTDELIRPVLRGRDIKRYSYDFADLWLINAHNGIKEKGINPIDINDYPAIKEHLDNYFTQLEKRADKGDTPYNLRNCAYMEDFYKQKIIYPGIMRVAKSNSLNFPRFCLDTNQNFFFGNDCYFIVGGNLKYLWFILNSFLIGYVFRYYIYSFDETGFKIFTDYFKNIPIPKPDKNTIAYFNNLDEKNINIGLIDQKVYEIYSLTDEEIYEVENHINVLLKLDITEIQ